MCIESIDTVSLPNVSQGNISVYCCISNVHTDTLYHDTKAAIYRYTQIVYTAPQTPASEIHYCD